MGAAGVLMTSTPATTPVLHSVVGPSAPLDEHADEQPRYRHVGGQRFLPDNEAARLEVARWNVWADEVTARTARSMDQ